MPILQPVKLFPLIVKSVMSLVIDNIFSQWKAKVDRLINGDTIATRLTERKVTLLSEALREAQVNL